MVIYVALKSNKENSGTTAGVVIIEHANGVRKIYSANCGDSKIVLRQVHCQKKFDSQRRGEEPVKLSQDHRASNLDEQKRLHDLGVNADPKIGGSDHRSVL